MSSNYDPATGGLSRVKADLHLHTSEDPCDILDYDAAQLLEKAAELGFGIIAITLHGKVLWRDDLAALADELGILLIPSVELRIDGCDVVVWNISPAEAQTVDSFADLRQLRQSRKDSIMMMAPHPFYKFGGSIGKRVFTEIDCFDAIELCHFRTRHIDPNRRAKSLATTAGKAFIATSDSHRLSTFGTYFTEIDLAPGFGVDEVFAALRAGRFYNTCPPMSYRQMVRALIFIFFTHEARKLRNKLAKSFAKSAI